MLDNFAAESNKKYITMTQDSIHKYLKSRIEYRGENWKFYSDKAYLRIDSLGRDIVVDLQSIQFPNSDPLIITSIVDLEYYLDQFPWRRNRHSDSDEYLDLFYPFEPNDIWRMAITKSERKRVILNKVYDRLELYLSNLVEQYRKEIPSLPFNEWQFERRRHTKGSNCIAYYNSNDMSIHFSLSAFMYGELELRNTIIHEMCHVRYCDHEPHFWRLLGDTLKQLGLNSGGFLIDYTKTARRSTKKKKTRPNVFPEIAKHRYHPTHETDAITIKAKQLSYINHSDYLTEKFDYSVKTLWEYTNAGCLRAAILLSGILEYGMKYHKMNNLHLLYLIQEKMLHLGYHRPHEFVLNCFCRGKNISQAYYMCDFEELIAAGSGLALINKADLLITQGRELTDAIELYHKAATKGYSVGWRILYCIFCFIKDNERANDALNHFIVSAPADKTNWRWIEILIDGVPNIKQTLSILSKKTQSAIRVLDDIYHKSTNKSVRQHIHTKFYNK